MKNVSQKEMLLDCLCDSLALDQQGSSILAVMVSLPLITMSMLAFAKILTNSNHFERGIASNSQKQDITNSLRLAFQNTYTCSKTGLIGLEVSQLTDESDNQRVEVNEIRFPNGSAIVKVGAVSPGTSRLVTGIGFTGMSLISEQSSSEVYLATLQVDTLATGRALGANNVPLTFHINVEVEKVSHKILSCGGNASDSNTSENHSGARAITGKYRGTCHYYSNEETYAPTQLYLDCPQTQRILLSGKPVSVNVATLGLGGKSAPIVQFSSYKTNLMQGWNASTTYFGVEFLDTSYLEKLNALIQFGGDSQSGYYFEVRKGLNIDWSHSHYSTIASVNQYYDTYVNPLFDGEYHFTAIVE